MNKSANDSKTKELIKKVEDRKASLGTRPKISWNTNGVFLYNKDSLNLNVIKDKDLIVTCVAHLLSIEESSKKAASLLGFDSHKVMYNGYSISDWIDDFKTRVSVIKWEEEHVKFVALEKKLATLISEEARTEMELADIEKSL